jgi:tripartite-type tricarboxylate transporter receptor subunit TctC
METPGRRTLHAGLGGAPCAAGDRVSGQRAAQEDPARRIIGAAPRRAGVELHVAHHALVHPDGARPGTRHRVDCMKPKNLIALTLLVAVAGAFAEACPDKNLTYWQAFPPGGESDMSARHQQLVLKKKCPAVETVVQYKAGGGGSLMWSGMNTLAGDGTQVVGINLPHIVLQPIEGQVQYKTEDVTPVYWFHYTPDVLVVPEQSPIRSFADFIKVAKASPGKLNIAGSGLNSANHAAHERLDDAFGVKSTYVPFKGTGDLVMAVLGAHVDAAMSYTVFAINNKGKVRALAVAMDKRHPLLPDVPTFRELGVDWVDGAFRGIGVPKSTPAAVKRRLSDLWASLNNDPEMKDLAARNGFELVNVGVDQMDAFMKERGAVYTEVARRMGLGK